MQFHRSDEGLYLVRGIYLAKYCGPGRGGNSSWGKKLTMRVQGKNLKVENEKEENCLKKRQ